MSEITLDDVPVPTEDFCKNAPEEYRDQCRRCLNTTTYECTRDNPEFGLKKTDTLQGDMAKKCCALEMRKSAMSQ